MSSSAVAEVNLLPPKGRVLIVGRSPESAVLLKHGDGVLFIDNPNQIMTEADIPGGLGGICMMDDLIPGDLARISELGLKRGLAVSKTGRGIPALLDKLLIMKAPRIGFDAHQIPLRRESEFSPPVVSKQPRQQKGEEPTMASHKPVRGELKAFVSENRNPQAENLTQEGKRLFALTEKVGLRTTEGSVYQSLLVVCRKKGHGKKSHTPKRKVMKKTRRRIATDSSLKDFASTVSEVVANLRGLKTMARQLQRRYTRLEKENSALRTNMETLETVRTYLKQRK